MLYFSMASLDARAAPNASRIDEHELLIVALARARECCRASCRAPAR